MRSALAMLALSLAGCVSAQVVRPGETPELAADEGLLEITTTAGVPVDATLCRGRDELECFSPPTLAVDHPEVTMRVGVGEYCVSSVIERRGSLSLDEVNIQRAYARMTASGDDGWRCVVVSSRERVRLDLGL